MKPLNQCLSICLSSKFYGSLIICEHDLLETSLLDYSLYKRQIYEFQRHFKIETENELGNQKIVFREDFEIFRN